MRPLAIFAPAEQGRILHDLLKQNALTPSRLPARSWPGDRRSEAGDQIAIVWPFNRTARLSLAEFGRTEDAGRRILSVQAEGVRYARRCLVPVSAIEVEEDGKIFRLTPNDADYVAIGATWWAGPKDRNYEPAQVALMTTGPQPESEAVLSAGFVAVAPRHRVDWMTSGRDTLSLQRNPVDCSFRFEEIVGGVDAVAA